MDLNTGWNLLRSRIREQGVRVTAWWAADHVVRILTGANVRRLSQITPQLYVGGQHRRRGWGRMRRWGVTAVVNMRIEYDDAQAGVASDRHLHLPVEDDTAPTLEQLHTGSRFIAAEIERGGVVYVHCGSGIGRAPTMAAAYFITVGLTAEEALDHIRARRPFIRPTAVQLEQLARFAMRQGDRGVGSNHGSRPERNSSLGNRRRDSSLERSREHGP